MAIELRSQKLHGRYAHRVRITNAGQSSFAGMTGVIARVDPGNWGTVYVRFEGRNLPVVPFARSEIEVLP
jgi:hypothetical protein